MSKLEGCEDKIGRLSPINRIMEQIARLDMILPSISEFSPEGERVRFYIVGQIEALKFVLKGLES